MSLDPDCMQSAVEFDVTVGIMELVLCDKCMGEHYHAVVLSACRTEPACVLF